MSKSYTSNKNVLKRHSSSGSTTISAPSTVQAWFNYTSTHTVNHNLGYIPQVRVYFESSPSDGKVYPAGGRRVAGTYDGISGFPVFCLWELTTTTLTIILESTSSETGTRAIYWVIYEDEDQ